jgi:hypothetical protein
MSWRPGCSQTPVLAKSAKNAYLSTRFHSQQQGLLKKLCTGARCLRPSEAPALAFIVARG